MTETKDAKTHFGYQTVGIEEKTQRVAEVFHSVAKRYDLMNDLMSFGLHHYWKRLAIARCALQDGDTVLDLASGTGDLSILLAGKNKASHIVLADINSAMLREAHAKLLDKGIKNPATFLQTSAESLPFPNNSFHCILIAFGLRNVTLKDRALAEMYRILRPGGRAVILEFSHPKDSFVKRLYDGYSFSVLPLLGKIICDDAASYRYLAESIRMHPTADALTAMMETAGFEGVDYQNIHKGIVALHVGYKY